MFCFHQNSYYMMVLLLVSLSLYIWGEVFDITPNVKTINPHRFKLLNEQMQRLQKSELHLHLGGSWPLEYLKDISYPQEYQELCYMLDKIQGGRVDYHSIFDVFKVISKIVNSDEKVENGVVALCQKLISDNVVYAEFRTGLKDLGSGFESYLAAVLRGIKRGTEGAPLKVGLILSLRRDSAYSIAEQTINLAIQNRDNGVVGIDLSGDSTKGDGKQIFPALQRAKEYHLPITLHIGESKEETSEQQMMELLTIQPERIGHAVHLCEEGIKWIKDRKVLVELCLKSAVKAGMITDPFEHPALSYMLEGHPVSICTDDPLVFNTTLSEEYSRVAYLTGLSPEEIQELQRHNEKYYFFFE